MINKYIHHLILFIKFDLTNLDIFLVIILMYIHNQFRYKFQLMPSNLHLKILEDKLFLLVKLFLDSINHFLDNNIQEVNQHSLLQILLLKLMLFFLQFIKPLSVYLEVSNNLIFIYIRIIHLLAKVYMLL